jgi:hypothetical protein
VKGLTHTRKRSKVAARFESDSAFVAHHENLLSAKVTTKHSHQWLSNIHADYRKIDCKVAKAERAGKCNDEVADSANALTNSNVTAANRVLVGEVGAGDGNDVRQDVGRCRKSLSVDRSETHVSKDGGDENRHRVECSSAEEVNDTDPPGPGLFEAFHDVAELETVLFDDGPTLNSLLCNFAFTLVKEEALVGPVGDEEEDEDSA